MLAPQMVAVAASMLTASSDGSIAASGGSELVVVAGATVELPIAAHPWCSGPRR